MDLVSGELVLNVYTLFLAFMLLLFQEGDKKSRSYKTFMRLVGIIVILVGVSVIGSIGTILGDDYLILKKIGSFFVFALDPFGFLFSLSYIDSFTEKADKRKRTLFIYPLQIYSILNLALVTVSTVFDLKWFYYYAGGEYYRGTFYMVRGLFHVVVCFIVIIYAFTFRKYINKNYRLPIMMFPFIVAVGGFLQVLVIRLSFEYASTVLACYMLLITVQKRDVNMDYLTGVFNRRALDMALSNSIEQSDSSFAAIMFDVDFFKTINDKYGHKTGDEVLENVAAILKSSFDKGDVIGRYGGDEFCVITKTADKTELKQKIDNVQRAVSDMDWDNKKDMKLSVSAGYEVYDRTGLLRPKEFMQLVDKHMYEEKLKHHMTDRRKTT